MKSSISLENHFNASNATALLVEENVQTLEQVATLLQCTSDVVYQQRLGNQQTQSLGKHVRHILEHYQTLLEALAGSDQQKAFDYEQRQREAALENDPNHALTRVRALQTRLKTYTSVPHDTLLTLHYPVEEIPASSRLPAATSLPITSSLGRELAFLTSHSIHHMALLCLFCEQLNIVLPSNIGVHPSTLRFWEKQRTAS
ncbi:hypothetical protein ELY33_16555 [Vreelandella andesensis]|uniref:DinB family protein n=1 Tax=Vreelandella andesensis TaxID=447567 RepID=A0A3S0YQ97_9GAMM|nr:hypothetical protein [Halomonas andesensis]RUR26720.1 hypothetical protein ELY33_16555 [Halomonas andesensis]